jgi:hypothetical protein
MLSRHYTHTNASMDKNNAQMDEIENDGSNSNSNSI